MEVDQSLRSRQVNYANRPQGISQNQPPRKRQRMYFATTTLQDTEHLQYNQQYKENDALNIGDGHYDDDPSIQQFK